MVERMDDGFKLSTGREVYANQRLVSIPIVEEEGDDPLQFGEGYDGHFSVADPKNRDYYGEVGVTWLLSPAEGIEVCDAMIEAWIKRRTKLLSYCRFPQAVP